MEFTYEPKLIEYMMSGTPVLTTELSGIPKDYYNYVYSMKNANIETIVNSINDIMCKDAQELEKKASAAREYILSNKNYKTQCLKILEMLGRIK